ncbi:MAG TPA: type II secretion system protein GspN [Polyangiaceae bacterium]|jgi:type II secretion system protein N|nr:type II secretion system protein GspN [Polyangiaceae bacterium]
MSPRLRRIAALVGYPLFYVACLVFFAYVSAPWDRVRRALVDAFNASSPLPVQIDKLTWSWHFPGVAASGVRFVGKSPGADANGKARQAPEYVVDDMYARVSVLPMLWGTQKLGFSLDGFGGNIDGTVKNSTEARELDLSLSGVDAAKMPYLGDLLGVPLGGTVDGKIELKMPQGKLSAAEGTTELEIADFTIGDGKTKIRDMIALPKVNAGKFVFHADVSEGTVKLTELSTSGPDLEVVSDGRIRLLDQFESSLAELNLRFKFSDKYKNKDDTTRSIFGTPGSTIPGLFDLDPKMKRARRADGFYAWHVVGPLFNLGIQPASGESTDSSASRSRRSSLRGFARPSLPSPPPPPPPPVAPQQAPPLQTGFYPPPGSPPPPPPDQPNQPSEAPAPADTSQ